MTILENLDTFAANGFHFETDEDAPPTQRLRVTKVPFSKTTTFGDNDIHELASLLAEDSPGVTNR